MIPPRFPPFGRIPVIDVCLLSLHVDLLPHPVHATRCFSRDLPRSYPCLLAFHVPPLFVRTHFLASSTIHLSMHAISLAIPHCNTTQHHVRTFLTVLDVPIPLARRARLIVALGMTTAFLFVCFDSSIWIESFPSMLAMVLVLQWRPRAHDGEVLGHRKFVAEVAVGVDPAISTFACPDAADRLLALGACKQSAPRAP
jgi:hypothetical protein